MNGDDFSFPGLSLYDEDPNSRFLDLYNRFSNQYPDIGNFLQPDDPDVLAYQKLSGEPTGSEELISSYMESMPEREQYKPSFGKKMLATLIGALSGDPSRAYATARHEVERPYTEAVQEWKMGGSNIASRARLMDAARQRELQSMKYRLQTKAGAKRSEFQKERTKLQEARRLADQVASEEKAKQDAADREENRAFQHRMAEAVFESNKAEREWRHNQAALAQTAKEEAEKKKALEANTLERVNKDLAAAASQRGIDTTKMSAQHIAQRMAAQDAKASEAFDDLIDETGNIIPPESDDPDSMHRRQILMVYLQHQTRKYLHGNFQRTGGF